MSFRFSLASAQEFLELHGKHDWAKGLASLLELYDQDPVEARRAFRSMASGPGSWTDFEILDSQGRSMPKQTAAWRKLVGRVNECQWDEEISYREANM